MGRPPGGNGGKYDRKLTGEMFHSKHEPARMVQVTREKKSIQRKGRSLGGGKHWKNGFATNRRTTRPTGETGGVGSLNTTEGEPVKKRSAIHPTLTKWSKMRFAKRKTPKYFKSQETKED